jgi:transcription initiation factor TFIIIB Brf1 subunit/transcription initiation factor TFIIB
MSPREKSEWKKTLKEIEVKNRKKPEKTKCKHEKTFEDPENGDLICADCYLVIKPSEETEAHMETYELELQNQKITVGTTKKR